MKDPDEYYKTIERKLVGELKSTGEQENAFWQHVGKVYNHQFSYGGKLFDEMLGNIDRQLAGRQKHGFEQNKKTDFEKLVEKGENNEEGNKSRQDS